MLSRRLDNLHGQHVNMRYRAEDEIALAEVLDGGRYLRTDLGFDVNPGDRWLDLGAGIGIFAAYCWTRGAVCMCYECDLLRYAILMNNLQAFNSVPNKNLFLGYNNKVIAAHPLIESPLPGMWGPRELWFDGVRCGLGGLEREIIDTVGFPECNNLVVSYHHDGNIVSYMERMALLERKYLVHRPIEKDGDIFCFRRH